MGSIKSIILFCVSLVILSFFNLVLIPENLLRHSQILMFLVIIAVSLLLLLVPNKSRVANSMALPINLLFASFFISMIPAYLFHYQTIFSSIMSYMVFYVFFLYFILFKLDYSYKQILELCLIFFYITLFIYIVDYYTFPNSLFASEGSFERRGAYTIRFDGQGFTVLGTFYFLAAFFRTKKFYNIILYLVGFCFLTLFSASRVFLVAMAVNTLFVLFYYRKTIQKHFLYIIPILVLAIITGIVFLESYIAGLYSLALDEMRTFESNIRYDAMKYFFDKFQPNALTKIIGNGYPAAGTYGDSFERITNYGFWTADLGLIGFWVYFGILGVIAWLIIFKKVFFWKTNDNNIYIKTYFITLLSTIFLGYALFSPGYMITTVFCLFLFDKDKQNSIGL